MIYTPLTGVDFIQKLLRPIPPSAVLFILQAGYDAEVIMPITLDSINGIDHQSRREKRLTFDPRFKQVAQLVHELQVTGALQVRIERWKEGNEIFLITFETTKDSQAQTEREKLRSLLHLRPTLQRFQVYYGGRNR